MDFSRVRTLSFLNVNPDYVMLPAEYKQVDWIGNTGNQYINTGIIPKSLPTIEIHNFKANQLGDRDYGFMSSTTNGSIVFNLNGATDYVRFGTATAAQTIKTWLNNNSSATQADKLLYQDNITWIVGETMSINKEDIVKYSGYDFSSNNQAILLIRGRNSPLVQFGNVKITINNIVEFYGIPCYNIQSGIIGMYDLISKTFLQNSGSGVFVKGDDSTPLITANIKKISENGIILWDKTILPDRYIQVEYIENTNTGIINLPHFNNVYWDFEFEIVSIITTTFSEGSYDSIVGAGSNMQISYASNGWGNGGGGISRNIPLPETNKKYHIIWNKDGDTDFSVNSIKAGMPRGSTTHSLFNGAYTKARAKLYYFKVYNRVDNTLIAHYVPVRNIDKQTVGVLDLINNQFYVASNNTIIAGPDVT